MTENETDPTPGAVSDDLGPLSDEEQGTVVAQLEDAYRRSQESYDSSIRTIAASSVAITASLVAALETAGWSGTLAVSFSPEFRS